MLRPLLVSILLLVPVAAPAASIRIESDGIEIVERGEVVEFGIWLDTAPGERVGFIVLGFGIPASDPWLAAAILLDYRVQPAVASPLQLEQFGILAPIGGCAPECFMGLGFLAELESPFVSNGASVWLGTLLYRPFMREQEVFMTTPIIREQRDGPSVFDGEPGALSLGVIRLAPEPAALVLLAPIGMFLVIRRRAAG